MWTDSPATGVELLGPTLARALAQAHRLRLQALTTPPGGDPPAAGFTTGQTVDLTTIDDFLYSPDSDDLTADYLRGLLTLGWTAPQPPRRHSSQFLDPALCTLLPFCGSAEYRLVSDWNTEPVAFTASEAPPGRAPAFSPVRPAGRRWVDGCVGSRMRRVNGKVLAIGEDAGGRSRWGVGGVRMSSTRAWIAAVGRRPEGSRRLALQEISALDSEQSVMEYPNSTLRSQHGSQ